MGLKVSAAQAGYIVHRHERVVRGWIAAGKLPAKKISATQYEVDTDDLGQVPIRAIIIDEARLRELAQSSGGSAASMLARIQKLESEVATLRRIVLAQSDHATASASLPYHEPIRATPSDEAMAEKPPQRVIHPLITNTQSAGRYSLPDGWLPVTDFARRHGISSTTLKSAAQANRIAHHRGKWKIGTHWVEYALDEEQQQLILAAYGQ